MTRPDAPIGAMDSGVGGLTVVQNLRRILPGEDVLFFGDSANCPYGNRSEDEVFDLAMNMLHSFEREGVKCVVVACNTMSAIIERIQRETELKLFSTFESTARYVAGLGLEHAGFVATERAVGSGALERALSAIKPDFRLASVSSHELAGMIDSGIIEGPALEAQIRAAIEELIAMGERERVILGCTHYPIAIDSFRKCYPQMDFINAAEAQAETAGSWLCENGLLRGGHSGRLLIRTSGGPTVFERVCRQLDIYENTVIQTLKKL